MKIKNYTTKIEFIALLVLLFIGSQKIAATNTIDLSGGCITETVVLSEAGLNDGKMAYTGTGTIFSVSNTQFALWWDAAESKWLLALDGQPFWYNSDNTTVPNSTLLSGNWTQAELSQGTCDVVIQGTATNMPVTTSIASTDTDIATIFSKEETIYIRLVSEGISTISVYELSGEKLNEIQTSDKAAQLTAVRKGTFIVKVQSTQGVKTQIVVIK